MCKYFDNTGPYKCKHKNFEDSDYCIFHLPDDNKDVNLFNEKINEILETEDNCMNFNGFYFPPNTSNFEYETFKGYAFFKNTEFKGTANFSNAKFKGTANFSNAKFKGIANFSNAKFIKEADFCHAVFHNSLSDYAIFNFAIFSREVYFNDVTFNVKASFDYAKFKEDAYFIDVTFGKDALFNSAEFHEILKISPRENSEIRFTSVHLSDNVIIEADLSKCSFNNSRIERVDMTGSSWVDDKPYLFSWEKIPINGNKKLREFLIQKFSTEWVKAAKIMKYNSDMVIGVTNEPNFLSLTLNDEKTNVDLEIDDGRTYEFIVKKQNGELNIYDKTKPKNSYSDSIKLLIKKVWGPKTSIKIWEEEHGNLKSDWEELGKIYGRLEQSYLKFGDNSTAAKFYYRKKECMRKQSKGFINIIWNNLIKILCGYGEKPRNLILSSVLIILVASILFFYYGIELLGSDILKIPPNVIDYNLKLNPLGIQWAIKNIDSILEDFLLCIYTSVITFTTLGYGDVHPIGVSRVVASVEAGVGTFLTALFIFVFTRKMLR